MAKRVTITLDETLEKKIRLYQAKNIQKTQSTYSFSRAINEIIRKSLKQMG